jgi:hypothetical protein
MNPAASPIVPAPARAVRLLHFSLTASITLLGAVFIMLVRFQHLAFGMSRDVGLVLAAIGVGLVAVASTVARRRIPERGSDQSPDTFWANPEATGAAVLLWALTEGAGLVGWVGYLLTGVTAPAVAAVIAIGALLVLRPSRLEGEASL